MVRFPTLCICVCAVVLCSVFVDDVDASGRIRIGGGGIRSWFGRKAPKSLSRTPSASRNTAINRHFLSSERGKAATPHVAPIGLEHFHKYTRKPQTNSPPIGFEHFQNPTSKSQNPIGFESYNKNSRAPSNPTMPVHHQNLSPYAPSAPAMPVPHQNIPQNSYTPTMPVHHQNIPHYAPSAPAMPVPNQNIPHTPYAPAVPVSKQNAPYTPSAPPLPVFHQTKPDSLGTPSVSTGFNQPVGGIIPSNQYLGKVNNPYQSNPHYGWNPYGNSHFKPSNSYPNSGYPNNGYPNIGYSNTGYPNTGYQNPSFPYNPSLPFGQSYNPNYGHQMYSSSYLGNSYYGTPNNFGNPYSGNSYNPYGNNYFSGGGYGYGGYPGQFGYNNYKPKSKFGFGGLPIPIPIPIPIPLGGFGFGGFGGHRNDDYSHGVLNSLLNTTSLNSTTNATSIYVVNNVTVVSCTNELFTYGPVNITVTTCTADNCTSVKVYVANNSSVNQSVLTMCLGPNVTVTSNSSNAIKPELTNISKYWQMVCIYSVNTTLNGTSKDTTTRNVSIPTLPTNFNATSTPALNLTSTMSAGTVNVSSASNYTVKTTLAGGGNATGNTNNTNRLCEILTCSYIVMCLPETGVDNSTRTAYKPCVRIKMCKSPSAPIFHSVALNTTAIRYDGVNKTESYSLQNVSVLAFYPIKNLSASSNLTLNNASFVFPVQPLANTTGFTQANNSSALCTGSDAASFCNITSNSNTTFSNNVTSSSNTTSRDYLELMDVTQRIERLQQLDTEIKNLNKL